MKSKEFIKMIQEADPTGEKYIRLSDGIPIFADPKPGYWDGPFAYINEDGKYVTSISGDKIDICIKSPADFIWSDLDREFDKIKKEKESKGEEYILDENEWFENLKKYFIFDGEYVKRHNREENLFNSLKEDFKEWVDYKKSKS